MQITVQNARGYSHASDGVVLVFGVFEDEKVHLTKVTDKKSAQAVRTLCEADIITGKCSEAHFLPSPDNPRGGVLLVGLGKRDAFTPEVLRRAAGKACTVLSQYRVSKIVLDASMHDAFPAEAFIEGLLLGQYRFDKYKSRKDESSTEQAVEECVVLADADSDLEKRCNLAHILCTSANWARDLANLPSNDLTPATLAERAKALAKEVGCACEILDENRMAKLGMNALLGVARGSDKRANLIILRYQHPDATKTVALVGKGITFDTGGVSIKPSEGMHEMKYDMCGAAAVLGAMRAVCLLKLKVNVICVVPAAENAVGPAAMTPGEIVKAYNGKTIEVHNTDAEGRLILADALAYTVATYKPDAIVDLATLTGAVIVALGHFAAGVLTSDDALYHSLQRSGDATGERVWQLPLWDDYGKLIEGTHADLCNIGPPKEAGSIIGGAFLKEFVGETPWAHIDIAGTAWGAKNISYLDTKFASGYGVRLLTHWLLHAC